MVTKEFAEASAEIVEILKYLPEEYNKKIPQKLINFLKEVKSNDYFFQVNPYKTLDEQKLKIKTKTLLIMIYRNYWCNDEEKKKIDEILIENEKKYESELRKKYNPGELFKNTRKSNANENEQKDLQIINEKNGFIYKLINYIKKVFNKGYKDGKNNIKK